MPEDASVDYEPFMVRVWRQCNQIRNSIVSQTGERANDWWSPRPADLLIVDEFVNGNQFTFGDAEANTLAFGATNSATIGFLVRFYYMVPDAAKAEGDEFKYYVVEKFIPWNNIETSVAEISVAGEGVNTYYNAQGLKSDKPFDGVNIVVTRYSDGSTKTTKIVR